MTIHTDTLTLILGFYYFARLLCFADIRPFNLLAKFNWFVDSIVVVFLGGIAFTALNLVGAGSTVLAITILTVIPTMEIVFSKVYPYVIASNFFDRIESKKNGILSQKNEGTNDH